MSEMLIGLRWYALPMEVRDALSLPCPTVATVGSLRAARLIRFNGSCDQLTLAGRARLSELEATEPPSWTIRAARAVAEALAQADTLDAVTLRPRAHAERVRVYAVLRRLGARAARMHGKEVPVS